MRHFKVEWGPALPNARNASRVRCLVDPSFTVTLRPQAAGAGTLVLKYREYELSGQSPFDAVSKHTDESWNFIEYELS